MKKKLLSSFLFLASIATFSQDGQLDTTFGTNGHYSNAFGFSEVYPQVKFCTTSNNVNTAFMGKYNNGVSLGSLQVLNDGTLNTGIYNNGIDIVEVEAGGMAQDGYIAQIIKSNDNLAVYSLINFDGSVAIITKVVGNGQFDPNFGNFGNITKLEPYNSSEDVTYIANRIKTQSDGKLLVIGDFTSVLNGSFINRFTANGIDDTTFNTTGYKHFNFTGVFPTISATDLTVLSDNSIIVTGYGSPLTGKSLFLYKLQSTGAEVASFGTNGFISHQKGISDTYGWGIYPNSDGSLLAIISVLESGAYNFYTAKFSATGVLDTTYGTSGYAFIGSFPGNYTDAHFRDSNNRLLVALGNKLYRILPNGAIDSSFGTSGFYTHNTTIGDVNSKDNNKIIVSGSFNNTVQISQLNTNTMSNNSFANTEILFYPNPTKHNLYIDTTEKIKSIQIIDITGKIVYSNENIENNSINVEQLENGSYIIKIINTKNQFITKPFIKI